MSYRLEYNWTVLRVPPRESGLSEERFVVAIEGGDNNVCNSRTGKRARDWQVGMIGTATAVLKQAVNKAGSCAGGMLQPQGRWCTPESYIRRIRRLIQAPYVENQGWWKPVIKVAPEHPAVALAHSLGITTEQEKWYGQPRVRVRFTPLQLAVYFYFVDRFAEVPAWRLAEVGGLPNS